MTALSLLFLLADGPKIRSWAEGHMGVPQPVARIVSHRTLGALRGYFLGVTIVAGFNALVVTAGALILDVPLVGTIAVVTFFGGFVPYLGSVDGGGVLGPARAGRRRHRRRGRDARRPAAGQQRPPAARAAVRDGAALGIHPLAVLVVTIAGGALFGAVGLILAAPLVSAVVRISAGPRSRAGRGGVPVRRAWPEVVARQA